MSNVAQLKPSTPSMQAVEALKDAHLEPTPFVTKGDLETVIDSTLAAIALEKGKDLYVKNSQLSLSQENGAPLLIDGVHTRLAYTRGAFQQILEKMQAGDRGAHPNETTSPSKLTDVAMWAPSKLRADLFSEAKKHGRRLTVEQTLRCALDAHNPDPARRQVAYVRAEVSGRHSAGIGDDTAFFAALSEFVSAERFAEFFTGSAYVRRDPAGETVGRVDSQKKLQGNARVTVGFKNNEIGEGAATVSSALVFEISARAQFGREVEPVRVEIAVPGSHGSARSIHLGHGPSTMFSGFAESLMFTLSWAPEAVKKMRTALLPQARIDSLRASLNKSLEGRDLRERQTEVGNFLERIGTDGVADCFSALAMVLVLTHFGNVRDAQALVTEFAGKVG